MNTSYDSYSLEYELAVWILSMARQGIHSYIIFYLCISLLVV